MEGRRVVDGGVTLGPLRRPERDVARGDHTAM
jgi:hypothetical protein